MKTLSKLATSKYIRGLRDQKKSDFSKFGGTLNNSYGLVNSNRNVVYHSLFGNARIVNDQTVDFLKNAQNGLSWEEATNVLSTDQIEDLLRLNYLVSENFDERSTIADLLAKREGRLETGELITSLQLILTNGCNFKCEYCFAYNFDGGVTERNSNGENVKPGKNMQSGQSLSNTNWNLNSNAAVRNPHINMNIPIAESAIEHAIENRIKHGSKNLAISLFGGEPTLNKSVILHILNKYKNGQEFGLKIDWEITTNGSFLPEDLLQCFSNYNIDVGVSIDYIDLVNNSFRGGGKETSDWSLIRDNVLRLINNGVKPTITSVLSKETWNYWNYDLIDWVSSIGLSEINVIVSFHPDFFKEYSPKCVAEKLLEAFRYAKTKRVLLSGYWYQTYLLIVDENKYNLQADYKTCPAIGRMLSIEPNGAVFSCKATNKLMGHIDKWDEIFVSDAYKEYGMRAYSNCKECRGCELEGTCSGGSAGQLEEAYNNIAHMNPGYCEYIRTLINGLLQEDLIVLESSKCLAVG